ncbi:MAG: coproporphyrinogen III oxidase family protein, partial [Muribaculaceae bacterium]|nr:coproporphyrinogen III oxidase family protein [Muribaculaceae bacterium]
MAGIYVHVPFCHAKCAYCDFYSLADTRRPGAFVEAVEREFQRRAGELGDSPVRTIYFGGGTPSILPGELFARLASFFPVAEAEEFTIEVNPEDVSPAAVGMWRNAGVNRVSIGIQSLVDTELRAVRRRHSAREAVRAIAMLRQGGISNISGDLIYGLPGQTPLSFKFSLDRLLETGISHLSAYNLGIEPGT